ncbi:MAG: preprotein translocase subunit SecG [Proteobacteria bacterium]|nr:preprotein translocase subunit SecG [Pseudomonadota bacterium]
MNWLQTLAVVFHVLLAVAIIGIVLLQRGKGADAGAGFGAGASGTVFGARGSASFLSRTTAVLATLFFLTSLGLTYLFSRQKEATSVVDTVTQQAPVPVTSPAPLPSLPATPATNTPAPATAPALAGPAGSAGRAGGPRRRRRKHRPATEAATI